MKEETNEKDGQTLSPLTMDVDNNKDASSLLQNNFPSSKTSSSTLLPLSKSQLSSISVPSTDSPSIYVTMAAAFFYIISGVTQPLLMTLAKYAGIADPKCQLYMLFYYIGPAMVSLTISYDSTSSNDKPPSKAAIRNSALIAVIDIFAQAMNYTGSTLAGPTLFAIIYSSVTVWTALYSRLILQRFMTIYQWLGVIIVFLGLIVTVFNSTSYGKDVVNGSMLVFVGSSLHALTYVLSEIIMTRGTAATSTSTHSNRLSVKMNCAVQGIVACVAYLLWQIIYTRQHFQESILEPMKVANTTYAYAIFILCTIAVSNLVHALTFFHTLKYFQGGATSAGVMKGLQAVLVFVVTSWFYCGRLGGSEMCFTTLKFMSLVIVVGGVILYGSATSRSNLEHRKGNYERINDSADN